MNAIEAAETMLKCIDHILTAYPENQEAICEYDKQTQDLLHKLEFMSSVNLKITRLIQGVRKDRRKLKDDNELLKPMYEFLTQGTSQAFKNGLINALSSSKRREKELETRVYTPRSQEYKDEEIRPKEAKAC